MDTPAASALIGLSVIEAFKVYREVAPKLSEVRSAPSTDPRISQGLLDAEVLAGVTAVVLAGGAAILTKSGLPLLLAAAGLLLLTQYYRSVYRSLPVGEAE